MCQVVCLKNKVNIRSKLNPFPIWERKEFIVVKDWIERFNPFGVDVAITNDPAKGVTIFINYLPWISSYHSILKLTRVLILLP